MSSTQIAVVVIAIVVIVLLVAGAVVIYRRQTLRRRFGPEYDRVLSEQDNRSAAERELRERERRHSELELHPLDPATRDRYVVEWEEVQVRFVDAPDQAVGRADALVTELIGERGYPTGEFDKQVAHLSVEHARTLDHYRTAREINQAHERGEASTEQLRQALVHYRALFADLLGTEPVRHSNGNSRAEDVPDRERHPHAPRQ